MLQEDFNRDYALHYNGTFGLLDGRVVTLTVSDNGRTFSVDGGKSTTTVEKLNEKGYEPIVLEDGLYNFQGCMWMYFREVERRYKKATSTRETISRVCCMSALLGGRTTINTREMTVLKSGRTTAFDKAVRDVTNGKYASRAISRKFGVGYMDLTDNLYMFLYTNPIGLITDGKVDLTNFPELKEELIDLGVQVHD